MNRFTAYINHWRLRLAHRLFPFNGYTSVANRLILRYTTAKVECSFVVRKRSEPDGVSYEEMIRTLDTFLGQESTNEQWNTLLSWKKS